MSNRRNLEALNLSFISGLDPRVCVDFVEQMDPVQGTGSHHAELIGRGEAFTAYRLRSGHGGDVAVKLASEEFLYRMGPRLLQKWLTFIKEASSNPDTMIPMHHVYQNRAQLALFMPFGEVVSRNEIDPEARGLIETSVSSIRDMGWHNLDTLQLARAQDALFCFDLSDFRPF